MELRQSEAKGVYVLATRDFSVGDIILEEAPLVVNNFTASVTPQIEEVCKENKLQSNFLYRAITTCAQSEEVRQRVLTLYCPNESHYTTPEAAARYHRIMTCIHRASEQNLLPTNVDLEMFIKFVFIWDVNSVRLDQSFDHLPGCSALFERFSRLCHSCFPNAVHFSRNQHQFVRCLRTIKKGDEITISYQSDASSLCSAFERNKELLMAEGFICGCVRCTADYCRMFCCIHCDGPVLVSAVSLRKSINNENGSSEVSDVKGGSGESRDSVVNNSNNSNNKSEGGESSGSSESVVSGGSDINNSDECECHHCHCDHEEEEELPAREGYGWREVEMVCQKCKYEYTPRQIRFAFEREDFLKHAVQDEDWITELWDRMFEGQDMRGEVQEAVQQCREFLDEQHWIFQKLLELQREMEDFLDNHEGALEAGQRLLSFARKAMGDVSFTEAMHHERLGNTLEAMQRWQDARASYREAERIYQLMLPVGHDFAKHAGVLVSKVDQRLQVLHMLCPFCGTSCSR